MKPDLESAWLKSSENERQDFIESYADDIRELLPRYNDHDEPETEELIAHGQDNGDDEQLDPAELPAVLDTNIGCSVNDDGDFAADYDEDFREATRGVDRRARGKRVTAAPSKDDLQRMTQEFLSRGGQIKKVRPGSSGLQPTKPRLPAWRKIVSSKGA